MGTSTLNITEPGDRQDTQRAIIKAARQQLSAQWGAMITLNPITQRFYGRCVLLSSLRERDVNLVQTWLEKIARQAMENGVETITTFSEPHDISIDGFNLKNTVAVEALLLRTKRNRNPMAVLLLGFGRETTPSHDNDREREALLLQSSSVLENLWLLGRYRAVIKIGQKLNRELKSYRDLFEKLRQEVGNIVDTSNFFMMSVYRPQDRTQNKYFSLEGGRPVVQDKMELDGACKAVLKSGRTLKSFHLSQDKDWKVDDVDLFGPGSRRSESVIIEPLIFRSEVLGFLTVQKPDPYAYDEEDARIMKLLGNQVALALSNLRLFKYLETLNEVGQRLTENLTSENLLQEIADQVKKATDADIVTLYPYLPSDGRFGRPVYSGDLRKPEFLQPEITSDNIALLTLNKGKPEWSKNSAKLYGSLGGDPEKREGNFENREGIRSTAALALQIVGEPRGVMFLNFRSPQRFPDSQKNLILGLANYAAIAIKNYREYTALNQRRYDDLVTLQKIDRQMRLTPGLQEIMEAILAGAVKRIPKADDSSILLYNKRMGQLETAASIGAHAEAYMRLTLPVAGKTSLAVWAYNNNKPVVVGNVKTDREWADHYCPVVEQTTSEMDFPLRDEDDVVGIISFESETENAFTKDDEEFVRTLAGQAVLAIRNAQLDKKLAFAAKELETLHEVAQKITIQESDPEEVMKFILKQARVLLGSEMGALQLYEGTVPGTAYLSEANAADGEGEIVTIQSGENGTPVNLGIVQHVAETRASYITEGDAQEDDFYEGEAHIHSEIAVPLISRSNDLIGVLDLESPRFYAFDRDDLKVLEAFARQAVIAIQYAERHSLAVNESRRLELLTEAGRGLGELSDIAQIKQAYKVVLDKFAEFNDGEILVRSFDETTRELVLEDVRHPREYHPPARLHISKGVNGQVAREHKIRVVPDLRNPPPDVATPVDDDPSVRTLAVTPIQFQDTRYYGNLVLSHPKAHSLTKSDISLLEGLAQQLAITIHRLEMVQARMEAEKQARDLTLLAEVGRSGLQISHRLSNQLALVATHVENIRLALSPADLENPAIIGELKKIVTEVGNVLKISEDVKEKVANIGREVAEARTTMPAADILEESLLAVTIPSHITVAWEVPDDLAQLNVVPSHIVDIMRNLIVNAIEVMPDEGKINIRASNYSTCVRIEVQDDGPGIPPSDQKKIFNLWFSTKGSSGFGLWSALHYASANGGQLIMQSEPGLGATFVLLLPAVERP